MRTLNETFPDDEFDTLKERKGNMTWREAILFWSREAVDE